MPIRVLQVVTKMDRAGIENLLIEIYRHIDRSKVQFDFYTFRLDPGHLDGEVLSLGGKIYYNPPLALTSLLRSDADLVKFLRQHPEYKIVHAHMNAWCGLLLRSALKAGVPVRIAHSHTSLKAAGLTNLIKNIIKLPVNRFATHRFAVSRQAGIWLYGKKAVEKGLVQIWANSIDYRKFTFNPDVRREMRSQNDWENKFVLMHVGNCRFEKNHPFLLEVFAQVRDQDPSAHLVLIGGGDWHSILSQAGRLGVGSNVSITGSRPDVNLLLQAGDVFVFPSLYEGMPVAVIEAQAAGLPCLISDSITDEVCITPLVEQCPLAAGPEIWAQKVLERKNQAGRTDWGEYFLQSGFDVENMAQKLTSFYLAVAGEN